VTFCRDANDGDGEAEDGAGAVRGETGGKEGTNKKHGCHNIRFRLSK